jgi:hypothetical protein
MRFLRLLRRIGPLRVYKLILNRINGAEIKSLLIEIERLNSRDQRLHPYISEAISLLQVKPVKISSLTGKKDGPLMGKFEKFGSDKESRHSYAEIYDEILHNFKEPRILEIGLGSVNAYPYAGIPPGGSSTAFRHAYPNSTIVGCDIDPESVQAINEIGFVLDQTSDTSLDSFRANLDADQVFDLIIDDGFHDIHANLRTLLKLYPLLSQNGFYVIEDVHVNMLKIWSLIQDYLPGELTVCDMSEIRPSTDDNILLIFTKGLNPK